MSIIEKIEALGVGKLAEGEWFQSRRVGGSTLAKLVGSNACTDSPALDCYMDAIGESSYSAGPAAEWGKRSEPFVISDLADRTGLPFEHLGDVCFVRRDCEWETTSPDAVAEDVDGSLVGAEIKCTTSKKSGEWGEAGTDDCRTDAWYQTQWNMHVLGIDIWYVTVLFRDTCRQQDYVVYRDDETIGYMREIAKDFWGHVQRREPPPPCKYGAPTRSRKGEPGSVSWKSVAMSYAQSLRNMSTQLCVAQREVLREAAGTDMEERARVALAWAERSARDTENMLKAVVQEHTSVKGG